MKSQYHIERELLERRKCETCGGIGRITDAGLGDIWANESECPDCRGEGLTQEKTLCVGGCGKNIEVKEDEMPICDDCLYVGGPEDDAEISQIGFDHG